jgi:hypothetical protein
MKTQTVLPSVPKRIPKGPSPEGPRSLLACLLEIFADWEPIFPQSRTHLRAVRQALGMLICLGRRTISRIIWTNGDQDKDWRADYFLFSRSPRVCIRTLQAGRYRECGGPPNCRFSPPRLLLTAI